MGLMMQLLPSFIIIENIPRSVLDCSWAPVQQHQSPSFPREWGNSLLRENGSQFSFDSQSARSCSIIRTWCFLDCHCRLLQHFTGHNRVPHCGTPQLRLACSCCAAPAQFSPQVPGTEQCHKAECTTGSGDGILLQQEPVLLLLLLLISSTNLADPCISPFPSVKQL